MGSAAVQPWCFLIRARILAAILSAAASAFCKVAEVVAKTRDIMCSFPGIHSPARVTITTHHTATHLTDLIDLAEFLLLSLTELLCSLLRSPGSRHVSDV